MKVYTYKVTDEAELDAKEIFEWYENKVQGLGNRFLSHLENSFNKIAFNPLAFANTGFLDFKRFILDFSLHNFYLLKDDIIIITAIIHKSRSQRYWRKKLKKRK